MLWIPQTAKPNANFIIKESVKISMEQQSNDNKQPTKNKNKQLPNNNN